MTNGISGSRLQITHEPFKAGMAILFCQSFILNLLAGLLITYLLLR